MSNHWTGIPLLIDIGTYAHHGTFIIGNVLGT